MTSEPLAIVQTARRISIEFLARRQGEVPGPGNHTAPVEELMKQFNLSDINAGLSTTQAQANLSTYGANELIPDKPNPFFVLLKCAKTLSHFVFFFFASYKV